MGCQPNLASRSEVVSIYSCPPPKKKMGPPQIWGTKTFFATFALNTAYLRNETSYRQTKVLVSIYNVFPKGWPTFRDLWPRNGRDPFAYCDPPFGGHYDATVIVGTCLVVIFGYAVALTEQGLIPVPSNCMSMYPAKISSRLTQWKRSTYQDFTVGARSLHVLCVQYNAGFPLTISCV